MNYEQKMRMLQWVKSEKKDELLMRIARGETVDITKDEDLFYRINVDRMSMDKVMDRDKYKPLAEHVKQTRAHIDDPQYGKTKGNKMRYLGEIPADIYFTHPWFSPNLPKEERDANVRKFFNQFPAFRIGQKDI
jgi:hypothetical protein